MDNEHKSFVAESEITIDSQTIGADTDSSKKKVFIDFQRPLKEQSANSMALESGSEYVAYLSYYLYKDGEQSKATKYTYGDVDGDAPKFETMVLQ